MPLELFLHPITDVAKAAAQTPETPGWFSLRLGVYPPSQVLQTAGRFYHVAPASHFDQGTAPSRVPLLHRHYPASSLIRTHPPPSRLRPTSRGHRLYGLPCSANFLAGRGGLLQLLGMSLSPCCRYHPAGVKCRFSQPAALHAAFALRIGGSASGATLFRGHLCVHSRYGPVTRSPSHGWLCRWASEYSVSLLPAIQATGSLALTLARLTLAEHTSLSWTHDHIFNLLESLRRKDNGDTRTFVRDKLADKAADKRRCGSLSQARFPKTIFKLQWPRLPQNFG